MPVLWRVELSPHAARGLKKLDRPVQVAIVTALAGLADELNGGTVLAAVTANVKKLVGSDPAEWRLRAGDYRARFRAEVCTIEKDPGDKASEPREEGVLVVTRVGHRREVYRD